MNDSRIVKLDVPATFGDVRTIDASITDLLQAVGGVDEGTIYNIELAVHEICSNIVEHAYADEPGGRILVTLSFSGSPHRELHVDLSDAGRAFNPATVATVDLDTPQEGGYGLFLAQALMDEVHYERRSEHNFWRLIKRL